MQTVVWGWSFCVTLEKAAPGRNSTNCGAAFWWVKYCTLDLSTQMNGANRYRSGYPCLWFTAWTWSKLQASPS